MDTAVLTGYIINSVIGLSAHLPAFYGSLLCHLSLVLPVQRCFCQLVVTGDNESHGFCGILIPHPHQKPHTTNVVLKSGSNVSFTSACSKTVSFVIIQPCQIINVKLDISFNLLIKSLVNQNIKHLELLLTFLVSLQRRCVSCISNMRPDNINCLYGWRERMFCQSGEMYEEVTMIQQSCFLDVIHVPKHAERSFGCDVRWQERWI